MRQIKIKFYSSSLSSSIVISSAFPTTGAGCSPVKVDFPFAATKAGLRAFSNALIGSISTPPLTASSAATPPALTADNLADK